MDPAPGRDEPRQSTVSRLGRALESARWLGALSAITSLLLCATAFVWALVKAVGYVNSKWPQVGGLGWPRVTV